MTLSERLADAARARGEVVVAPTPPPHPAPVIVLPPEPEVDRRRIVAIASHRVTTVEPDPSALPESVCPTCGRTGELSVVDLPGRSAGWTCGACATLWQVALPDAEHASS